MVELLKRKEKICLKFLLNRVNVMLGMMSLLFSHLAFAGMHFTLEGSISDNNLGSSIQNSGKGAASVAVDLGQYFRIGGTHRLEFERVRGMIEDATLAQREYSKETQITSNSLDLTIVLYYGEIFVPYLQIGYIKKYYQIVAEVEGAPKVSQSTPLDPGPNAGAGLGVRLNRNFSLKFSYSVSAGVSSALPGEKPRAVLDSYTSVGISYNI